MKFKYFCLFGLLFAELVVSETDPDKDRPSWSSGLPEREHKVKKLKQPKLKLEKGVQVQKPVVDSPDLQVEIDESAFEVKTEAPDLSEIQVQEKKSGFLGLFKDKQADNSLDEEQPETEEVLSEDVYDDIEEEEPYETEPETIEKRVTGRERRALLAKQLRTEEQAKRQQGRTQASSEDAQYAKLIEQNSKKYRWKIIKQAALDYPRSAARRNLQGWVDVNVTVDTKGKVVKAHAEKYSEQGEIFVSPALKALRKYRFDPPSKQGIDTVVNHTYRIEFKL